MKALMVVVASLFFSSALKAEDAKKSELTDSFTDSIKAVIEEDQALIVSFERHGTLYNVSKIDPKFTEIKAKIEKAQKIDQKIKVVAIIPSMTIKEIQY